MRPQRLGRSLGGFTLIEMTIAVVVTATLLGSIAFFQARSEQASKAMVRRSDLERRADRALQMVTRALRGAGVHTLVPDPNGAFGTGSIRFQTPSDISAEGVVVWNTPTTVAIQMDTGEIDNGLDDDGDGRIDERALVITREIGTPEERATTICHGIAAWADGEIANGLDDNGNGILDERGFNVHRVGDLLYLNLTLESPAGDGRILRCSTSTALALHN
jgi:type II secretory pathway pseudopilin PulG